ncbi:hypothetical protein [Cohnella yongneupensis]|uniref:Uncharacterized protein n=1 Tax=Cohnella yongneupensis TaxID=425006 RepID=A0ABW0QX10_9BACL
MNIKRMFMAGTVAATITIGGGLWTEKTSAASTFKPAAVQVPSSSAVSATESERKRDDFLVALGKSSDEEVYNALYDGKSLAEIASDSGNSAQGVIDLQLAELTRQLDARLSSGMLAPQIYEAQKSELQEIVAKSVYGDKWLLK